MAGPRAVRLAPGVGGRMASARSKTGDPACSQAMSDWKTKGMSAAVAAVLGRCRAAARTKRQAETHANVGRDLAAQHLQHRVASGQALTAKDRTAKARELLAARRYGPGYKAAMVVRHDTTRMKAAEANYQAGQATKREAAARKTAGIEKGKATRAKKKQAEQARRDSYRRRGLDQSPNEDIRRTEKARELLAARQSRNAAPVMAATPRSTARPGKATPERLVTARGLREARGKLRQGWDDAAHTTISNHTTARYQRNQAAEKAAAEARLAANRARNVQRNTRNVELVRDYLAKGGHAQIATHRHVAMLDSRHVGVIRGVNKSGEILVNTGRETSAIPAGSPTEQILVRGARSAKARELLAQRKAARSTPAPAQPPATQAPPKPSAKRSKSRAAEMLQSGEISRSPETGLYHRGPYSAKTPGELVRRTDKTASQKQRDAEQTAFAVRFARRNARVAKVAEKRGLRLTTPDYRALIRGRPSSVQPIRDRLATELRAKRQLMQAR